MTSSAARLTCFLALAGATWGQVNNPAFEVATIKRSDQNADAGLMMRDPRLVALAHVSVQNLLAQAYRIKNFQISGPSWLDSERFDIVAKLPDGASQDQLPGMLQTLLKERFQLAFHQERRTVSAYALVPGKAGAKLNAIDAEIGGVQTSMRGDHRRVSGKVTMAYFAGLLSNMLDRPVVDVTELKGVYDVDLQWSADQASGGDLDSTPSLFTVLQEKMGLRLDPRKMPVDFYVIDHVMRLPTEN
jgi:uncharacterized protein (TIGR03435 family)